MNSTQQSLTLPSRTSQPAIQNLAKSVPALQKSKSNPSRKYKNATHNRHQNSWTETAKTYTGQGSKMIQDRMPACNI